jgi:AraC family transcriptional activator of pobA
MDATSLEELCYRLSTGSSTDLSALLPSDIQQEVGHFNVFSLTDLPQTAREKPELPYACRAFYKISLLTGRSQAQYVNDTIEIAQPTLIFSTPKVPFYWLPEGRQTGQFCVFTAEFLQPTKSGVLLDELPVFKAPGYPIHSLSETDFLRVQAIFEQIQAEMASDYAYKYDLIRTYVLQLIHIGQKLQSSTALHPNHNASARMTSLFIELLEQQFPLENPQQQVRLRTAIDYANHLAVHVNHLNKVLKETTGLTTTDLIAGRIVQEAKGLLTQTDWTIANIADSLGFADVAHFAKFFKRETSFAPGAFRAQVNSLNYT